MKIPSNDKGPTYIRCTCAVCGGHRAKFTKWRKVFGKSNLVECTRCGVRFYDEPMEEPEQFYNTPSYDNYIDRHVENGSPFLHEPKPGELERYTKTRRRTYSRMVETLREVMTCGLSSVFEIGAAWGLFLEVARDHCGVPNVAGCDLSRRGVEVAKERGVEVLHGPFIETPHRMVDAVVSMDCIEHTPTPGADLAKAFEITRPGGGIIVKTFYDEWHDHADIDLSADNLHGVKGYLSAGYFGTSHLFHFTTDALVNAICRAGFRVGHLQHHESCGQVDVYAVSP